MTTRLLAEQQQHGRTKIDLTKNPKLSEDISYQQVHLLQSELTKQTQWFTTQERMYQDTIQELRDECEMLRKQISDIEFHNHNMQAMTFEMKTLFDKAMRDKPKDNDLIPY